MRGVGTELLERYFERTGHRYTFRKDLRRSVIFGRNDLPVLGSALHGLDEQPAGVILMMEQDERAVAAPAAETSAGAGRARRSRPVRRVVIGSCG